VTPELERKTREANRLLAVTTGLALAGVVTVSAVMGPAGPLRAVVSAAGVLVAYLLIRRYLMKRTDPPPLIRPDAPVTLTLGAILPLIVFGFAAAIAFWPDQILIDLGLITGAVLFGQTLESAFSRGASAP
jgi:hypothetical protein